MDAKQMGAQCGQMMGEESPEGGEAAGMRELRGRMAAMCWGGDAAGMLKRCEQMAARFSGQGETAEEPKQGEPQGPQFA